MGFRKRDARQDNRSRSKVIMGKPASELTKEEKKILSARMAEIRSESGGNSTVQNTIPFLCMYKDGVCQVSENFYSLTVQFFDANYSISEFDEQNYIFSKYCDIINLFDNTIKFQLTFENQNRTKEKLIKTVQIPEQEDDFNDIRQEYSKMLTDKLLKGSNGQSTRKFLTFGIESTSYKAARAKLFGIKNDVIKGFKAFGVDAEVLDGRQRLEALYYALNPYKNQPFIFDWDSMLHAGMDSKDFIAPSSLKFNKSNFEIGNAYGAVWGLNILAGELPDEILRDFLEMQNLFCVNIHVEPLDQVDALKFVRKKLTAVESMKVDEQKKASQAGYDSDILPPAIKMYIEDIEKLLGDLNSKNERLFHISISLRAYERSKKELKLLSEMLKRTCQKNNCTMFPYDYRQEQTLVSTLPLCYNAIPVSREMHTSGIAIFVPFTTKELFQDGQATYYGINTLSGNMIRANRSLLKNPNGLILGTPGAGKSFSVKREILDCFLTTTDDIIICDPEGEYFPLVSALHGQLIRIASNSEQHINPMDITIDEYLFSNPMEVIANKSDFLISLCEIIVGGRYGLSAEERSIIDKCVQRIYKHFIENEPTPEKMPLLSNLQKELQAEGDVALRVSNSLEMFVNGSQNLFNHHTNIDMTNRIICFDVKELGNQLKKVGMLIVQDTVWNRVSANREKKKITRYYIDEFHLLLKEEQTAKYSAEIWKRFRKWGGVPTGITQNVKDLLSSQEVENIFDNSDFVYMLNQAAGDRDILAEKLHISKEQMKYVTNSGRGILHRTVNLKYRVKGDKPSVTRFINSQNPPTVKGHIAKKTAQAVSFAVHDVTQTAVDVGLAAETTAIKVGENAQREVRNKLKQKYTREAVDDYHKGVFLMGRTVVDAVKGTRNHFKQKKQFQLKKAKYRLKKADNKLFKAKTYKPKMAKTKADLKAAKAEYKSKIVRDRGNKLRRAMNKRRLQAYRQSKRELKFERKQLKTDKKYRRKEQSIQREIAKDSKPTLLALKPISYSASRMRASAWQKAVNEDQDNDFVHAIDSAKRRIVEPAMQKVSKPERLQREQKKRDSQHDKRLKSDDRLKKQESRLKDKHDSYKQRKRKPKQQNKQTKRTVKDVISQAYKYIKNIYEKEVKKLFGAVAVPILIILLVFAFIIMIFTSVMSGGGFTLGTYAAQDYDLSEAEKYYTKLAYEMNEKILMVSDSDDWKKGLTKFGANKKDLKDKPDNWYWGKTDVYDWEPQWDFDCYKLWSFLCAYYYDFDAENGDIKYWEFDGDTEDLLEEIFNDEYEFVYWYDNKSRWEELDPYNYWGGGNASSGKYYRAEQDTYIYDDEPYRYRFKPIAYTSEIGQYRDSDGYICITADYRVLDPNDDYALTGFYVRDNRYYAGDSEPFYYIDNDTGTFFFMHGSERHDRSFWGWDGTDAWFLISPTDTTIWNSDITDTCMYAYYEKYYWKTECNLYYNVKQKKTFDEVIEDKLKSLSHKTERWQYYNLLVGNEDGNTMYGNHQTLRNMLPSDSIRDYSLKREFGYEMNGWNQASDGLYQGIKVYADSGTKLKMPFSGKITDVDTDENKITIRKDDVEYWYDGTGGTKRDTEVTIANAVLINDYEKGDSIKEGKEFAKTTAGNVNFHVYIDTDGYGWDYIDPRLVLY